MRLPPDFSYDLLHASALGAAAAAALGLVSAVLHFFVAPAAPTASSGGAARVARYVSKAAFLCFVAGFGASLAGLFVRWHEVNHFPVQTMFEALASTATAIFVSYAAIHVVLKLGRTAGLARGLADLLLVLVMTGEFALVRYAVSLETAPRPLPPALQSYWMPFHVSSLLLSYVTLSIAYLGCLLYFTLKLVRQWFGGGPPLRNPLGAGAIVAFLGFVFLVPFAQIVNAAVFVPVALAGIVLAKTGRLAKLDSWIEGFDKFSFSIFAIGFPFLTAGLMMGAFWAQEAWALYWGWDSKETSALISWLVYVVYLHLRFVAGWKDERGLAVILGGAVSILITFQLFGYLPASQDSLHKYTDGVSREGTELSGTPESPSQGSPATPSPGGR